MQYSRYRSRQENQMRPDVDPSHCPSWSTVCFSHPLSLCISFSVSLCLCLFRSVGMSLCLSILLPLLLYNYVSCFVFLPLCHYILFSLLLCNSVSCFAFLSLFLPLSFPPSLSLSQVSLSISLSFCLYLFRCLCIPLSLSVFLFCLLCFFIILFLVSLSCPYLVCCSIYVGLVCLLPFLMYSNLVWELCFGPSEGGEKSRKPGCNSGVHIFCCPDARVSWSVIPICIDVIRALQRSSNET
jgi:hypothetical protein